LSKAWEVELDLRRKERPKLGWKPAWNALGEIEAVDDKLIKALWDSNVPGSGASECLMRGAVQAAGNMGLDVSLAEALLPRGYRALEENDLISLHKVTASIWQKLDSAPVDHEADYWEFKLIDSWEKHKLECVFPAPEPIDIGDPRIRERIFGGWLAQVCGGAFGTALEGYVTDRLIETYGEINGYVTSPDTSNDDITYELAFLKAFEKKGHAVTSNDIAEEWVAHIAFGWSAEYIALNNLKLGVFPPESGTRSNPFSEWIGAQMRGTVLGMVTPGDPMEAARLAWIDGVISHQRNGVLGEAFNAVMAALAFVETDVRRLVQDAASCIPEGTQYRFVVDTAITACQQAPEWLMAWRKCMGGLERYNWVHAYPNAAAEIIALWYGAGNFDKTMSIIGMAGQDVDCNAAQIATVLGIMYGPDVVGRQWSDPIHNNLHTYMRGMEDFKITELANWTARLLSEHRSEK